MSHPELRPLRRGESLGEPPAVVKGGLSPLLEILHERARLVTSFQIGYEPKDHGSLRPGCESPEADV